MQAKKPCKKEEDTYDRGFNNRLVELGLEEAFSEEKNASHNNHGRGDVRVALHTRQGAYKDISAWRIHCWANRSESEMLLGGKARAN